MAAGEEEGGGGGGLLARLEVPLAIDSELVLNGSSSEEEGGRKRGGLPTDGKKMLVLF